MSREKIAIKTPEFVSLNFKLAGLGSRAGAMIIDQILLLIVNIALVLFFMLTLNVTIQFGKPSLIFAIAIIILFLIRWGYFFVSEYFFGGKTVGKKMIGIRVIQENGHSITLLSCFIRNLLRIIDMLPTSYFIGIIMIFFHSQHKRLGDMIAGTIVVHEREVKKKENPIENMLHARGVTKDSLPVSDLAIKSLRMKEWKLLKAYSERIIRLGVVEGRDLTQKVASIILPKVNLSPENKTTPELENTLLILYLHLKEEWEYEL